MPSEKNINSSQDSQSRRLGVAVPPSYATYVDRWAIVVGISKYKDERLNLKYADRDAEELVKVLQSPSGGAFEKERIVKLVNEEATTANITRALRSFLKKPAKDDIVLIYFACHGAPDLDRPGIVYLLTHDTDPKDISGTALPMREINLSLQENLLAERIIILADTCHSAAIGGGIARRDASDNSNVVNSYLREVSKSKGGIALLTSAEANEVSFEDKKWGGGHGVFTYYLLEGMQGAADQKPRNGIVTVGELFDYVRDNVQRATDNQQHPCIGTNNYDRNLPVAITAGISAQEHYELGCQLYQLGLKLDDKYCFDSASRHLQEAINLARAAGKKFSEAYLHLGLALMAVDRLLLAIEAFTNAVKADINDAAYYLGIAYLKQHESEKAVQAFESFLIKQPDSDKASYTRKLISWLSPLESSNHYALLIGINYSGTNDKLFKPLQGPVNDIQILNELLSKKYGFQVKMLPDREATYENIMISFKELEEKSKYNDVVVIYYGGHEMDGQLIAYDTNVDNEGVRHNVIEIKELYKLIDLIPSSHKTLILDSVISQEFEEFIRKVKQTNNCTLFLAASPGQFSYEVAFEGKKRNGVFTYLLVKELNQALEKEEQGKIFHRVKEAVKSKFDGKQVPCFNGNPNQNFFTEKLNYCPDTLALTFRCNYSGLTGAYLQRLYEKYNQYITNPFPDFYYAVGLAFLEKNNYTQAITALSTALEQTKNNQSNILFALGTAQLKSQLYREAIQTFRNYLQIPCTANQNNLMKEVISILEQIKEPRRYALLVGIEDYINAEISSVQGATSDVIKLKNILQNKLGFLESDITVLLNKEANRHNILTAFKELVEKSLIYPALFYFSGNGSVDEQDNPTIVSADSRQLGINDIKLNELEKIVRNANTNLVSFIDANWAATSESETLQENRYRYIPYSKNENLSTRAAVYLIPEERDLLKIPQIGCISLFPEQIKYSKDSIYVEKFTEYLLEQLNEKDTMKLTYSHLKNYISEKAENLLFIKNSDRNDLEQIIFNNNATLKTVHELLAKIVLEPTTQIVLILKRLIEQRNNVAPEEHLNLGIAYYILGEYDKSISELQIAIDQVLGQNSRFNEQASSPDKHYPEAHYWLGRVLHESKRDPARAVSELRLATQQDPNNLAAHYYLGQALRALVEQEILTEAERAFQTYLKAGAPLGQEENIQEFLKTRKSEKGN
jgi:uncharacterized caspase-like protein/Tfp pilus assembly protein PilF